MLSVMVSKWVADALNKEGIYDEHIALNGYPFLDNKREYRFTTQAIDVMSTRDLCVVTEVGHTIGDLKGLLASHKYAGFPIVNNTTDMNVRGYITRAELRAALDRALGPTQTFTATTACYFADLPPSTKAHGLDMAPWMDAAPLTVVDHTTTNIVFDLFKKMGLRVVLVVTEESRLVGIITKKDVLRHLPKTKK